MVDQLTRALIISFIALAVLLLWALSIALILKDLKRRDLPGYEQIAWVGLAALIPFVGGAAYLFTRLLESSFSPRGSKKPLSEKRVTAYKKVDDLARHLPTVAAVDTYRATIADLNLNIDPGPARDTRAILYLEILAGPDAGQMHAIETLPVRIGRGAQTTLSLDADQGVSRQHAEIYASEGRLRIRDLESRHGTYLNGRRIIDESLNPGDKFLVGQSTVILTVKDLDDIS
ncbi:MAG: FHA domain-containing protein [Anaerolineales bacterium]|jgi:hypothetical protein